MGYLGDSGDRMILGSAFRLHVATCERCREDTCLFGLALYRSMAHAMNLGEVGAGLAALQAFLRRRGLQ